jgi:hypothetical protein
MAEDALLALALSMYAGEPCRVCGRVLTAKVDLVLGKE